MANAMDCMEKEVQVCCQDGTFRTSTCVPLWYCHVAIGKRDFGPVPPCGAAPKSGDASKCQQSDGQIRKSMEMAKSMCFDKIKELYDLQGKLGQCVADVSSEKQKLQSTRQGLTNTQHRAEDCEKREAQAKAQKSLGLGGASGSTFCPARSAELSGASSQFALAMDKCIGVEFAAAVRIPTIDIEERGIRARNIGIPSAM